MNGRKEAWVTQRIRESEWPASFDGDYGAVRTVKWFARTPKDGIPAASEYDATITLDVDGVPTEFPVMDGEDQAKARALGSAECKLYYQDDDGDLQPSVEQTDEGEYVIETITVENWSFNPIPGGVFVKTEVEGGRHVVANAECKKYEDDGTTEYVVDGGEWT